MNLKYKRKYIMLMAVAIISLYFNWLSVAFVRQINKDVTKKPQMKYILQWTGHTLPFIFWDTGQEEFIKRKCKFNNCYITSNGLHLKNITDYDVVAFLIPEIATNFPHLKNRSERQKYTCVSMESAMYFPLCDEAYDDFFNWTWTYKLNSDLPFVYIIVRNINGDIIGPKQNMNWTNIDLMKPVDEEFRKRLKTKNKAAVWFVSNIRSLSKREDYAVELRFELDSYDLQLDIFGEGGDNKCPRENMTDCLKIIEKEYYFYLAFENSFAEDYVTEKLLMALQHYAIPVVFGGSNYTRFMPDGIYLNGGEMKPKALAKEMANIIKDKERYYSFFKWHNHYSYHAMDESPETDGHCKMCEMLHNEELMQETTVYKDLRNWWNSPRGCLK